MNKYNMHETGSTVHRIFLSRVYAEILSWSATREDVNEPTYSGLPQEIEADSEDQINMTANKTARV